MAISPKARLQRGSQIAYIPTHAKGNVNHPDVQFGFVTSGPTFDNAYFCRYWQSKTRVELRTKSCSELTPGSMLIEYPVFVQSEIEAALKAYC